MAIVAREAGLLELAIARDAVGNRTVVHPLAQNAPLKTMRPYYPDGVCHVVILNNAGGIVGGDRLSIKATAGSGTEAVLTSAGAEKVYRSDGREARQTVDLVVHEGAHLAWLPRDTILFDGAIYRQDLTVDLDPGATWIGSDITRFGRTAQGEQFLSGTWCAFTEIRRAGIPLWIDRQRLRSGYLANDSLLALAGWAVVGTLAFLGRPVDTALIAEARNAWHGSGETGVTRLPAGFLCRYRGDSTADARRWFECVASLARQALA